MVEKMWPTLQSCKHQANDLFDRLPDDLLFFIMSFLTLKETARTSVLSRRWNYLWRCFPVLIFEDLSVMVKVFKHYVSIPQERARFMRRVNQVLEGHLGPYVHELRVTFDLKKRQCQSAIDKWLVFAAAKQVKRLELDFSPPLPNTWKCSLPKWRLSLDQPHNLKYCLHSLSLTFVNITSKDIGCLLCSCTVLENLYIKTSKCLKYIKAFGVPLRLKHLEVIFCPHLRSIDILAPKLLSFAYIGFPIELHIRNASLLSKLSLGKDHCDEDILAYGLESLSKYFSQLEYLSWKLQLYFGSSLISQARQMNLGITSPPAMTNLKHLELDIYALCEQTLLGWADFIEASPLLERLTLKVHADCNAVPHRRIIIKRNGRPLKSLKTLELYGDIGLPIDLEFATYVVENSIILEDVIVKLRPLFSPLSNYVSMEDRVAKIKRIVPQGVKLTLSTVDNSSLLLKYFE